MSYSINLTSTSEKKSWKKIILLLALLPLAGAAALVWYLALALPERRAAEEARFFTAELAPVIRAEGLDQERLARFRARLAASQPQSRTGQYIVKGAEAFFKDDFQTADTFFALAEDAYPELSDLTSFRAAINLREGNIARARDKYLSALTAKTQAGADPVSLAADQMGLALALFMLHQIEEALPLAEKAYQARLKTLGSDDADTLSAANRLATILVALQKVDEADKILRSAWQAGLRGENSAAALEETKLLLSVIYNQRGQMDELEHFLAQAPPPAPAKPAPSSEPEKTAQVGSAPPAAPPPPETPEIRPETVAAWENAATALAGYNDRLAADLWLKIIQTRETMEGLGRYSRELRPAVIALTRAYAASGQNDLATEEIRLLHGEATAGEAYELDRLAVEILKSEGRLGEVESLWQEAAEEVDARISAQVRNRKAPDPDDAARSLDLHLKLADLFLTQGRVPQEAEIELKAALGRLSRNYADNYPETTRVYLRLARILWSMGHNRESAEFYRRAEGIAQDLLKKETRPETKAALTETARLAKDEGALLAAKKPAPDFEPQAAAAVAPGQLPPPDLLRQELTALAALERVDEFPAILDPVLAEAARRFSPSSQNYMRYYSLKLKSLEEAGQVDELTSELTAQAADPPGRNEAEKALNRGSALIYAARVNEKAGREEKATALYRQALDALSGREEEVISSRRRGVEAELERLEKK